MNKITQKKEKNQCIYCSQPEIKERTIIENDLAWVFPTNIPITKGHTLISPKRCVKKLGDLSKEEKLSIFNMADKIMVALKKAYGAKGFNCAWNEENLAGQFISHFHLHIIPRKEGDTGLLGYDPRNMLYRTGDRKPTSQNELLKVRDKIQNVLL